MVEVADSEADFLAEDLDEAGAPLIHFPKNLTSKPRWIQREVIALLEVRCVVKDLISGDDREDASVASAVSTRSGFLRLLLCIVSPVLTPASSTA